MPFIKREVIVSGDSFHWKEIAKFIHFQVPAFARKTFTVYQIVSTLLSRSRHKQVNVMVHIYGHQVCSKAVHGEFVGILLQPEQQLPLCQCKQYSSIYSNGCG